MSSKPFNIVFTFMLLIFSFLPMASFALKTISPTLFTTLVLVSILVILFIFSFSNNLNSLQTDYFHVTTRQSSSQVDTSTNISHIVFGLLGSTEAWQYRKAYIESWLRPNVTRGYLFLDAPPTNDLLPWSPNSPPFRISDNITKLLDETKHVAPIMVRMVHAVIEVFREEREGVRWYIMGDDDSIFFVDNLVDVLSDYDHNKYVYIGGQSESIMSNYFYSNDMGFGGAGLIMSYPLVKMVQKNIEDCFKRYPYLNSADLILMTCVNDFGVSVTTHQGLHQIDLHGDISGFLSSHPKAPLLSLHHFDHIDPIFRSLDSFESAKHLMKAAKVNQPRLVQQTICYNKQLNWSFSVSWGYSIHVYEKVIPRSILKVPLKTFKPWISNSRPPYYIFNTRPLSNDPCETPHVFSFESVEKVSENEVVTNYIRMGARGLPTCRFSDNHSADLVSRIQVVSPTTKPNKNGKTECCEVVGGDRMEVAKLRLRDCFDDELIA